MRRINNSFSFVFDSFIIPGLSGETPLFAILMPGIRIQRKEGFAFQFGLTGLYTEFGDEGYQFAPFPVPMVQLYWKF